jgi:hypothetical protein
MAIPSFMEKSERVGGEKERERVEKRKRDREEEREKERIESERDSGKREVLHYQQYGGL